MSDIGLDVGHDSGQDVSGLTTAMPAAVVNLALCPGGIPDTNVALDPFLQASTGSIGNPNGGGTLASCYFGFTGTTAFGLRAFAYGGFSWKVWTATGTVIGSSTLSGDSAFTDHPNLLTGLTAGTHYVAQVSMVNARLSHLIGDSGVTLTGDVFGNTVSIAGVPNFTRQTWAANAAHPTAGYTMVCSQDAAYTMPTGVQLNGMQAVGTGGSFTNVSTNGFIQHTNGGLGGGNYMVNVGAALMEVETRAKSDTIWAYVQMAASTWSVYVDEARKRRIVSTNSGNFEWVQVAGFGSDGYGSAAFHGLKCRLGDGSGLAVAAFMFTNNDGTNGQIAAVTPRKLLLAAGDSITKGKALNGTGDDSCLSYVSAIMDAYGFAGTTVAISATFMTKHYYVPANSQGYAANTPHPYEWGSQAVSGEQYGQTIADFCHNNAVYFDYFLGSWATNDWGSFGVQVPASVYQTAFHNCLQNMFTGTSGSDVLAHLTRAVFLGPLDRSNSPLLSTDVYNDGTVPNQQIDYYNALATEVGAFGNSKIKAWNQIGGVPNTSATYLPDGLHPSAAGAAAQGAWDIPAFASMVIRRTFGIRHGFRSLN
jgi:hypothetical protein